jgi:quercetin dioxygenase-like cupin family protein
MKPAKVTELFDDSRKRVNRFEFEDGAETGVHVHEFDYVVVPITGGQFRAETAAGEVKSIDQEAGVAYQGIAGTHHNVINSSGQAAVFVEIELKTSS